MTLKGGTSQACAACKYQRKRCTPECALAPHFRPEQTEIFKNAHKLFGVKNILKILEQIEPAQKTEAMRSIIYQANLRERFPVHGCLGIVCELQYNIKLAEKELYAILSQIEFYKQHQHRPQQEMITLSPPMDSSESQQLQLGIGIEQSAGNPALTLFQHDATTTDQNNDQQFLPVTALPIPEYNSGHDGYSNSINHIDCKDNITNMGNNLMWGGPHQQTYRNEINDHDGKTGVPSLQSQLLNTTIQEEVTHDYDEIYPFFDTIDDTQSYIHSKEANESSSESSLKDMIQSTVTHVEMDRLRKYAEVQVNKYMLSI